MIYFQVLDTPEPLRNLADLIAAQLEFHKRAFEIFSELAPEVEALQVEQEVSRGIFSFSRHKTDSPLHYTSSSRPEMKIVHCGPSATSMCKTNLC